MEKYKPIFTQTEIKKFIEEIDHIEKRELMDFYEQTLYALLDACSHIECLERTINDGKS